MDRKRLGWLAGLFGLILALARLDRLLTTGSSGSAWLLVLVAAALLGGVVTFTTIGLGAGVTATVATNLGGAALAVFRVAAPETLWWGILPTVASLQVTGREVGFAVELIRYGAAPVVASAGLVAVLAALFWGLGAVLTFGVTSGHPWWAVLPPLVFYLQLATLDRQPPIWTWVAASALTAGLVLLGTAPARAGGRLRSSDGRILQRSGVALPVSFLALGIAAAVAGAGLLAAAVPESGYINWRNRTLFGLGVYGGWSSNLFVGLQQQLVSQSPEPVFLARVSGADPADLYWRILTLEDFDGTYWLPAEQTLRRPGPAGSWERPDLAFQGPTVSVNQVVVIQSLRESLLPILYSPVELRIENAPILEESYRVREDGSIKIDALTTEGLTYRVSSLVPAPDIEALATRGTGLSPIFAQAAAAGAFTGEPKSIEPGSRPDNYATYLELPADFPPEVQTLASAITARGATSYERALLLEAFFTRPESGFTYSIEVDTGHASLDLGRWLLDPDSRNFRTGYCEQFATAMAAMARAAGLASRVVLGFAPGDVETDGGGELIVVRQRHAHAWVELWMPGQGWVRFDPTPRADGITRPAAKTLGFDPSLYVPAPDEAEGGSIGDPAGSGRDPRFPLEDFPFDPFGGLGPDTGLRLPGPLALGLAGTLLVAMGSVPAWKWWRRRQRLLRFRRGDITAAWEEIVDRLADLGSAVSPDLTPLEAARHNEILALVPLASAYAEAVYGPSPRVPPSTQAQAAASFEATEEQLRRRHPAGRRLAAWFRPTFRMRRRRGAPR